MIRFFADIENIIVASLCAMAFVFGFAISKGIIYPSMIRCVNLEYSQQK